MGVAFLVWQIRFESASANVSGILHCTALWRDFKLFYSLLSFNEAHVHFCFHWLALQEGVADRIAFLSYPLSIHLCAKSSLWQTPAFLTLGASRPAP